MLHSMARIAALSALVLILPTSSAHAQAPFAFSPDTSTCSGVPDAQEVAGTWQATASPASPRVGDPVTMGLRGSGASLQVTLILVGPDGEVIDLLDGNAGDDQVVEFTKPVAAP